MRKAPPVEHVPVIFGGKSTKTAVYEREGLVSGQALRGPAVITEYSATTVIPPGKKFWVDQAGNLVIAVK